MKRIVRLDPEFVCNPFGSKKKKLCHSKGEQCEANNSCDLDEQLTGLARFHSSHLANEEADGRQVSQPPVYLKKSNELGEYDEDPSHCLPFMTERLK